MANANQTHGDLKIPRTRVVLFGLACILLFVGLAGITVVAEFAVGLSGNADFGGFGAGGHGNQLWWAKPTEFAIPVVAIALAVTLLNVLARLILRSPPGSDPRLQQR